MNEPNTSTSTTPSSSVISATKRKFAFHQPSAVSEDSGHLKTIILLCELLSITGGGFGLYIVRSQFTDHSAR